MKLNHKFKRRLFHLLLMIFFISHITDILYLAMEADHHCDTEHCFVCTHVQHLENNMKEMGGAPTIILIAVALSQNINLRPCLHYNKDKLQTPITLKIRMNN